VYPYYLLEPYVFGAAWWLARPGNALNWRASAPLLLTADVFLAKSAATLPFDGWGLAEGVTSSVILAGVVALVVLDLYRTPADAEASVSSSRSSSNGSIRICSSVPIASRTPASRYFNPGRWPSPRLPSVVGQVMTIDPECASRAMSASPTQIACTTLVRGPIVVESKVIVERHHFRLR